MNFRSIRGAIGGVCHRVVLGTTNNTRKV